MTERLYGRKQRGQEAEAQYGNAAGFVNQLNQRAPAVQLRGRGESLGAVQERAKQWGQIETSTYAVRNAEAEAAIRRVQSYAGQLAAQAYQYGAATGDWDGYNARLAEIGRFENAQMAGGAAMRGMQSQTLRAFQGRMALGDLMSQAAESGSRDLQQWASLGLSAQRSDRQFAMDEWERGVQADRWARQDQMDERRLGLDERRLGMEGLTRAMDAEERAARLKLAQDEAVDMREYRQGMLKRGEEQDRDRVEMAGERSRGQMALALVRQGHTPDAVEAWMQGDSSLLQEERESGDAGITVTRSSSGRGKKGKGDEFDAEKNGAYIRAYAQRQYGDMSWLDADPEGEDKLTQTFGVMRGRYGNDQDAMDATIAMIRPEALMDATMKRAGVKLAGEGKAKGTNELEAMQNWGGSTGSAGVGLTRGEVMPQVLGRFAAYQEENPDMPVRDAAILSLGDVLGQYGDQYMKGMPGLVKELARIEKGQESGKAITMDRGGKKPSGRSSSPEGDSAIPAAPGPRSRGREVHASVEYEQTAPPRVDYPEPAIAAMERDVPAQQEEYYVEPYEPYRYHDAFNAMHGARMDERRRRREMRGLN
jgi:hypothetical protein